MPNLALDETNRVTVIGTNELRSCQFARRCREKSSKLIKELVGKEDLVAYTLALLKLSAYACRLSLHILCSTQSGLSTAWTGSEGPQTVLRKIIKSRNKTGRDFF